MSGEIIHQIDEGCQIGDGVDIWHFASITRGAVIGHGSSIGANATIDGAKIGMRCRIQSGARLFAGAVLEDNVFVGPNAVICNDFFPRVEKTGFYSNSYDKKPCVVVETGASICANATILPGVRIGRYAMIAAGSKVDVDVPDWTIWTREGKAIAIDRSRHIQRVRYARNA